MKRHRWTAVQVEGLGHEECGSCGAVRHYEPYGGVPVPRYWRSREDFLADRRGRLCFRSFALASEVPCTEARRSP